MKEKFVKFGIVLLVFLLSVGLALAVLSSYISVTGTATVTAAPKWFQTDWSGGPGQAVWSDQTMFDSSNNINYFTSGEIKLSNTGGLQNITTFYDSFSGWSTTTNCDGASASGWTQCIATGSGVKWRANTTYVPDLINTTDSKVLAGTGISQNDVAELYKCLDTSSFTYLYVRFDIGQSSMSSTEWLNVSVNKTGAGTFSNIYGVGNGDINPLSTKEFDVTNWISTYTCFRIKINKAQGGGKSGFIDDFKIIGTQGGTSQYSSSGDLTSSTFDAGSTSSWKRIYFTATKPANTDVQFQIATNNDGSTWNFVGPDGTPSTYYTTTGTDIYSAQSGRYARYKVYLSTSDNSVTPVLDDVTIYYRT